MRGDIFNQVKSTADDILAEDQAIFKAVMRTVESRFATPWSP